MNPAHHKLKISSSDCQWCARLSEVNKKAPAKGFKLYLPLRSPDKKFFTQAPSTFRL